MAGFEVITEGHQADSDESGRGNFTAFASFASKLEVCAGCKITRNVSSGQRRSPTRLLTTWRNAADSFCRLIPHLSPEHQTKDNRRVLFQSLKHHCIFENNT